VRDVGDQGLRPAPGRLARRRALVRRLDQGSLGAGDEEDVGALGAEHPGGGASDAAACAGHHAGATAEPKIHCSVLVLELLDQLH
jgi:hypothetical protein